MPYTSYAWQLPYWPAWRYESRELAPLLGSVRMAQRRLLGSMQDLGMDLQSQANLSMLTEDVIKAGFAHLWFALLHPFDDGNGRIARAIGDMALSRAEGLAPRYYSLSAQIQRERKAYYDEFEAAQKGSMDITRWLMWFLGCLLRALEGAELSLASVLFKARFWRVWAQQRLCVGQFV